MAGTTIVIPDQPSQQEKFAAQELSDHLKKITGDETTVVAENGFNGTKPVIYVGKTKSGAEEAKKLTHPEQWLIKSEGKDTLLLTGSDPRGIVFSIYVFLDKFCGVRWFDEKNCLIPENKNFKLPDVHLTGYPNMRTRFIYDGLDFYRTTNIFKMRNRGQSYGTADIADYPMVGSPGPHHTFYNYANRFPDKNEKLFALNERGERPKDTGGQLCMTNPDTRKYVLQTLKEFIAADRRKAAAEGVPPPVIYDISANDNPNCCCCPDCKKIADREDGAYSAPQLDFINYIAREIRKTYPEIYIRTFAYLYSYQPPKTMKAEPNVIIHLAILGSEFGGNGKHDTMRPLSHPNNAEALGLLQAWSLHAENIAFWDYWKLFGSDHNSISSAYVNMAAITDNFPIYAQYKGHDFFVELESPESTSFFGLKRYIGMRMLEDPKRNPETETTEFMQGMYGKAAPVMQKYLSFLTEEQDKVSAPLGKIAVHLREYFTGAYFTKAFALLDEASSIAENAGDPRCLANIRREYIPLYATAIRRYPRFSEAEKKQFDYAKMLSEYEKQISASIDYYYPRQGDKRNYNAVHKAKLQRNLFIFREANRVFPVPEQFAGKKVIVVPYFKFKQKYTKLVTDPDSAYGKAVSLGKETPSKTKNGCTEFGVWDQDRKCQLSTVKLKNENLPQDEKYHIVRIGKVPLRNASPYFWGSNSWQIQCVLEEFFEPAASMKENTYDVYMSVKFTGHPYVKDSVKEERIAVDAIFLVQ